VSWRVAVVAELRDETDTARTLALDVADWPGHDAGQHVDVRLTAPDGYTAVRPYSIASGPGQRRVELTVEVDPDGEVSPYLARDVTVGEQLEIRGPLGGWFVWRPAQTEPVQLIAGGSGLVPLMSMLRSRAAAHSTAPFRLLYSVRAPEAMLYAEELLAAGAVDGVEVSVAYTRKAPAGWSDPVGRVDAARLATTTWAPAERPTTYLCGPTAFVETVADLLLAAGHDAGRIRTERFG
jgi:ferredoxin-NADP reductase